jgi:uncharacterized protein affecting Mg2+/Co2+ transport
LTAHAGGGSTVAGELQLIVEPHRHIFATGAWIVGARLPSIGMYRTTTRDIVVEVEPFYLSDQSNPEDNRFVWGYRVTISNNSDEPVQLRSRYWRITDGVGRVEEVHGEGVVGEQPEINPGDRLSVAHAIGLHGRQLQHADPIG